MRLTSRRAQLKKVKSLESHTDFEDFRRQAVALVCSDLALERCGARHGGLGAALAHQGLISADGYNIGFLSLVILMNHA